MKNEKVYNPTMIQRKKITDMYSYTLYTLPKAPDLPPISPRRKVQLIPNSHEIRNVSDKVHELEKTTILTNPRDPIKDLRRDVQESNERLLVAKAGYPLYHINFSNSKSLERQQSQPPNLKDKVLEVDPPHYSSVYVKENTNVYVYHNKSMSASPASEIQNEFNLMKHNINETNRKRYNQVIKELSLRNKRRPSVIHQMYEDIEKYGMEESILRAKRARQYSSLKMKKDESWWEDFIDSVPEDLRTKKMTRYIDDFSKIRFYNEENILKYVYEHSKTSKSQNICHELMVLANKAGSLLNDDRLEFIFYKAEKNREKDE